MDASIFVACCALAVSCITLLWQYESQRNKEITACAVATLESAFMVLTAGDPSVAPKPVLVRWISSARQIERYKRLKRTITLPEYFSRCEQTEDLYRERFSSVLRKISPNDISYFQKSEEEWPEIMANSEPIGLNPVALTVVFSFGCTPIKDEPLALVSIPDYLANTNDLKINPALLTYLKQTGNIPQNFTAADN